MAVLNFDTIKEKGQELIHDTLRDNISKRDCNLIVDFGSSDVEKRIGYPIIEVGEFDFISTYTRLGARLRLPITCDLVVHARTAKQLRTLSNKVLSVLDRKRITFELDYNLYRYKFRAVSNIPERIGGTKYHSGNIYLGYEWQSTSNRTEADGITT